MTILSTIRDAFGDLPDQETGVIFKPAKPNRKGKVSFWVGKRRQVEVKEGIKRVLGWGDPTLDGVYGEDFLRGMVREAARWPEGAMITVCPIFSEIFNGASDLNSSISTEDQIAELKRLIALMNPKGEVEVRDVSELKQHSSFFNFLKEFVDESGVFNTEDFNRYMDEDYEGNLDLKTTKGIFLKLVEAGRSAPRSSIFAKALDACQSEHYKSSESAWYYGLAEVAVRMYELCYEGHEIQGGLTIQGKYDKVIQLIKTANPKKEKNQFIRELKVALFSERKDFRKVYINTQGEQDSFDSADGKKRSAQRRIFTSSMVAGTALVSTLSAGVMMDNQIDEWKQEARISQMYEFAEGELMRNHVRFSNDLGGLYISSERLPEFTKEMVALILPEVRRRYSELDLVSDYDLEEMILKTIIRDIDRMYTSLDRVGAAYTMARQYEEWDYISDEHLHGILTYPGNRFKEVPYPSLEYIYKPSLTGSDKLSVWVDLFVEDHKAEWERYYDVSEIGAPYDHLLNPEASTLIQGQEGYSIKGEFCSSEPERACYWVTNESSGGLKATRTGSDDPSSYQTGELVDVLYQRSQVRFNASFYSDVGFYLTNVSIGNMETLNPKPIDPKDINLSFNWRLRDFKSHFSGQTYEIYAHVEPKPNDNWQWEMVHPIARTQRLEVENEELLSANTAEQLFPEIALGHHWLSYCNGVVENDAYSYPDEALCEQVWPEELQLEYDKDRHPYASYVAAKSSQKVDSAVEQD